MTRTLDDLEIEMRAVVRGERPAPPPPPPTEGAVDACGVPTVASRLLMQVIATRQPASVSRLAEMVGRRQSNVSRALQDLAKHGFVRLVREGQAIRPEVVATHLDIDLIANVCRPRVEAAAAE